MLAASVAYRLHEPGKSPGIVCHSHEAIDHATTDWRGRRGISQPPGDCRHWARRGLGASHLWKARAFQAEDHLKTLTPELDAIRGERASPRAEELKCEE